MQVCICVLLYMYMYVLIMYTRTVCKQQVISN
jgi:hypothetical protein